MTNQNPTASSPADEEKQERRYRGFMAVESLILVTTIAGFLALVSRKPVPINWLIAHLTACLVAILGLWLIWRKSEQDPARPSWPPFRRYMLFLNLGGLGALLGLLLGTAIGVITGTRYGTVDYGGIAGVWVGITYGGVTGWTCSKLRECSRSTSQRLLSVVPWPVGGLLVAVSTVEAVRIGDTKELWSMPLLIFGIPMGLTFGACIAQFVLSENRLRLHEDSDTEQTSPPATGVNHVCQGSGNCAIACMATVTGRTYDEVAAWCPKTKTNKAPNWQDMITLLSALSGSQWRLVPLSMFTLRLDEFLFP